MDRLTVPKVGDKITAKWAASLIDEIRRQKIVPGPGYKTKVTSQGTVLALTDERDRGGSGVKGLDDAVYIAQCIAEPNDDGSIPVDLYKSDLSGPVVCNAVAFRPDLTHYSKMDVGTRFIVHAICITMNNGGDAL